jgi:Undecaprenyl-phosphate glucose phosphotransferase
MNDPGAFQLDQVARTSGASKGLARFVTAAAMAGDFATVLGTVAITSLIYHLLVYDHVGDIDRTVELALLLSMIFVFTNLLQRRYRLRRYLSSKGQILEAFNVWNVTMVAFIAIGFLAKIVDNYSRAVVILSYMAGIPLITLSRYWIVRTISRASKTGRIAAQRIMIVGRESEVMSFIQRHQPWNYGLMVEEIMLLRADRDADGGARELADLQTAVMHARLKRPDSVFIALPWSERALIERCIDAFMTAPVAIHLAPEQILERFDNPRITQLGAISSLELTPPPLGAIEVSLKRAFDLGVSAALLVLLAPALLLIAAAIKLDSRGPIFFVQGRLGFNQQLFRIFKFRTMRCMDDGDHVPQATANDPRITRVGRVLRRYNLDELPQLMNVILGQMSLVGPRPHAVAHDRDYEQRIGLYARRHNVKPGITGWAQVHGLRGETQTDDKMAKRIAYDLWYIDNWSFWLDVVIMFQTVFKPSAYRNAR